MGVGAGVELGIAVYVGMGVIVGLLITWISAVAGFEQAATIQGNIPIMT
jgi:hypothetical protein